MAAAAAAVRGAKQSLRAELKQRLQAMSAEERLRQSRLLTQKVIAHSQYQKSRRISIFLSMQDEIETEEIIKDIFQQGKTCFIPQYQFQSNHMEMVKLASPEEISLLPKTSWNIHQPAEGEVREEALSTGSHVSCALSDRITEAQGGQVTSPRTHRQIMIMRQSPSSLGFHSSAL
ncbi:5-formyltetrahydrofolate cyclo-ligase isoform X5 [Loxodonta africana]|uniref:5-formyltetrahydrofolate cyclo-ligase isoform X5 n=1 Tax=Loxodonta africana TaxID=9785 RepID=UPI000C810CB1|nr:5-formyltetrahydrofolate cyclo-ligase isoform X5 [Loxodonta africana]